MTYDSLVTYLNACATWDNPDLLVTGHPAPDGDTVVSALFEAWRRYLADGTRAVPLVQAAAIPREITFLLGAVSERMPLADTLSHHPSAPLVLTDTQTPPAGRRVVAIVDHHRPVPGTDFTGVDAAISLAGATASLVALRIQKDGLEPDSRVARLLLGAILLDTEGLRPGKMKAEDDAAVAWLAPLWGGDLAALHTALQDELLSETDVATLYRRDYRRYGGNGLPTVGFAILKTREQCPPDTTAVAAMLAHDVTVQGIDLCVAKLAMYGADGRRVERYLADGHPALVAQLMAMVAEAAGPLAQRVGERELWLPAEAIHRGRKTLMTTLLAKFA